MKARTAKRVYWPTRGWKTADPESVGMHPDLHLDLDKVLNAQYSSINGILIAKNGYRVFERYSNGFRPDDAQHVASVTKSVISALVGITIEAGYIDSIDQKVLDFFPEYAANANDIQKRAITIRHLLTMTAPIASKSTSRRGNEPLDRLRRQRNWVRYIISQLGRNGQPGKFQYSTAGAHLLSAIITRATGICACEFANEHLFRPIGMREIPDREMKSFQLEDVFGKDLNGWIKDPQGNSAGGWGLTLTPRDMARFGFLYLNRGVWDHQQIISEQWIAESLAPNPNNYGYLWWLREAGNLSAFSALGSGGNLICCVPEKDLVVAIASKITKISSDQWWLIENCILPRIRE